MEGLSLPNWLAPRSCRHLARLLIAGHSSNVLFQRGRQKWGERPVAPKHPNKNSSSDPRARVPPHFGVKFSTGVFTRDIRTNSRHSTKRSEMGGTRAHTAELNIVLGQALRTKIVVGGGRWERPQNGNERSIFPAHCWRSALFSESGLISTEEVPNANLPVQPWRSPSLPGALATAKGPFGDSQIFVGHQSFSVGFHRALHVLDS